MRDRRARRGDHEFERSRRVDGHRSPHAVSACRFRQRRGALPLAGLGGDAIDFHFCALDSAVGRRAVDDAGHAPVQHDVSLGRDRDPSQALGR
jgi:hypothetical protein